MQDLRLLGVDEDGEHLLLADGDGARYRVALDEALRSAVRREAPHLARLQVDRDHSLRPRDVQALIRAGASAEEVAQRAGWTVDKVRRYEGPIVAEREYVAGLARDARVRGRSGAGGSGSQALAGRVAERLAERGVDPELVTWDAWRTDDGPWTVVVTFAAGGRQRSASWHFDTVDRVVVPVDDEARWLGEDESRAVLPAGARARPAVSEAERARPPYDVEAEGGVRSEAEPDPGAAPEGSPVDLMTAMRQRSGARGRRSTGPARREAPTQAERLAGDLDEELPLAGVPAPVQPAPADPAAEGVDAPSHPPVGEAIGAAQHRTEPDHSEGVAEQALAGPAETRDERQPEPQRVAPAPAEDVAGAAATAPDPDEGSATPATSGPAETADQPEPTGDGRRRRPGRRGGRPSVPSWDDIMFGTRQGSDGS